MEIRTAERGAPDAARRQKTCPLIKQLSMKHSTWQQWVCLYRSIADIVVRRWRGGQVSPSLPLILPTTVTASSPTSPTTSRLLSQTHS